jgi:hypothetical protein
MSLSRHVASNFMDTNFHTAVAHLECQWTAVAVLRRLTGALRKRLAPREIESRMGFGRLYRAAPNGASASMKHDVAQPLNFLNGAVKNDRAIQKTKRATSG